MKTPILRYEQTAREADAAIARLRKLAPTYEYLGKIEAAVDDLRRAISSIENREVDTQD